MGRKNERSEPPVSVKRPIRSGNLVKSLVEKFEKKSQPSLPNCEEHEVPGIVEPMAVKRSSSNDDTNDFSSMQQMKFFNEPSFDSNNFDMTNNQECVYPSSELSLEFQTNFDFPTPFSDPFDPFELSKNANVCTPNSEVDSEPIVSLAMSKMQAKFRQKVSDYGDEKIPDLSVEANSRICLAPSSVSIASHYISPRSVQRPRLSNVTPDLPLKSPRTGERTRFVTLPDLPLSSARVTSPDTGMRPRPVMIPDLPSKSSAFHSPNSGQRTRSSVATMDTNSNNSISTDWRPHDCLSPNNDTKPLNSVETPKQGQKPRISMISSKKSPTTPGRRRIALAPLTTTNESPNHPHSNRVKLLISPEDMKRIKLSLSTGEKLTLDPSSGLKTMHCGGSSGPKRIAMRSKETNGARKIVCIESLQALLSQQVQSSAPTQETRSLSTPRQGLRRTSLTMTPKTTQKSKARVTPVDVTSLKGEPPKSGTFQKQRRRHSFSASSLGLFVDDAASLEHGFDVITDRAGQSIAPPPNEKKTRRKSKKGSKRDVV
jgi:hypothetical protein